MTMPTPGLAAAARLPIFYRWTDISRIEAAPGKPAELPIPPAFTLFTVESGAMRLLDERGLCVAELSAGDLCVTVGTTRVESGASGYAVAFDQLPQGGIGAGEPGIACPEDGGLLFNTRLRVRPHALECIRQLHALRDAADWSGMYGANALFQRLIASVIEAGTAAAEPERPGFRDAVSATLARMEAQPGLAWTIERLAREAGCSVRQYARIFRSLTGKSPIKHLTGLRMAEAKRKLASEEASLAQLSGSLGFTDPFHFSRAFKRHEGLAPSV